MTSTARQRRNILHRYRVLQLIYTKTYRNFIVKFTQNTLKIQKMRKIRRDTKNTKIAYKVSIYSETVSFINKLRILSFSLNCFSFYLRIASLHRSYHIILQFLGLRRGNCTQFSCSGRSKSSPFVRFLNFVLLYNKLPRFSNNAVDDRWDLLFSGGF